MNITKLTESYISQRPSIRDCLKRRLINYSSLSRQIGRELEIRNFEAILIACRRYATKLKQEEVREDNIRRILSQSRIELRNKMVAFVIDKDVRGSEFVELEREIRKKRGTLKVIEGATASTLITEEDFLETVRQWFKGNILKTNKGLAQITVKSPTDIERTTGVLSYLCSLFSDNDINIVENMSCWTDTIFLVHEPDAPRAVKALRF